MAASAVRIDVASQSELIAWIEDVARHRDRIAFTRLFDHFAPRLNGYLQRLGSDAALAEEVTQDVMMTLWHKAALFDSSKSSVSTWLFRIARNRRIDLMRRNKVDYLDPNEPALAPVDNPEIERMIDVQQREEAVRQAMVQLPPEQLALVRLAFFEGLSHGDIAERTQLPLGTVKSRIRLAFTRLRRALEAEGVVEIG
jgi:RNA polymerase sigma factor (sigma-70 family)